MNAKEQALEKVSDLHGEAGALAFALQAAVVSRRKPFKLKFNAKWARC